MSKSVCEFPALIASSGAKLDRSTAEVCGFEKRISWRLNIDREKAGPLVTRGVFSRSRNPIYLSFDLLVAGSFLIHGRLLFLGVGLVVAATLHALIRREETFLAGCYGDAYRAYAARVGRYWTWRRVATG